MTTPLGFVNVFKPAGTTSAQCGRARAADLRRSRRHRLPAGHLGTLDPQAAGVLPVAIGKATRLIPLHRGSPQGVRVHDRSSAARPRRGTRGGDRAEPARCRPTLDALLRAAAARFVGIVEQIPPMFSAVHQDGRRLYEIAREGARSRAQVAQDHDLRAARSRLRGAAARMRVACSEGTYVRTLCEDLGNAVGIARAHGGAGARGSGPFVLYESSHARRDRRGAGGRAGRRRSASSRFRRSCSTAAGRPTFAPAASSRCRGGAANRTCSCATDRARWSASARRSERCLRRARCSCEDPSRTRRTRRRRAAARRLRSGSSTACIAGTARFARTLAAAAQTRRSAPAC